MKFGLMIIVVALMGSIIAGSISMETGTHQEISYDRVTDLAPTVTSSPVDSVLQYNPVANVTGWVNANYTYQNPPSIYSVTPPTATTTRTSNSLGSMGGVYYADGAAYGGGSGFAYGGEYPYIVWSDMSSGTDPTDEQLPLMGWNARDVMIGGHSQTWTQSGYNVQSVVTVGVRQGTSGTIDYPTSATNSYFWQDLNRVAAAENWATGTVVSSVMTPSTGGPVGIAQNLGLTFDGSYLERVVYEDPSSLTPGQTIVFWRTSGTQILNIYWLEEAQYWWNGNTRSFYQITGYDRAGFPITSTDPTPLVWISHSLTDTIELTVWENAGVKYIKPDTDIGVSPGTTAYWNNGYDNERVQILMTPSASGLWINDAGAYYLPEAASSYPMVRVTLEPNLMDSYWEGITRYSSPTDYSVIEYARPLFTPEMTALGDPYYRDTITAVFGGASSPPYLAWPAGSEVRLTLNGGAGTWSIDGDNASIAGSVAYIDALTDKVTITYTEYLTPTTPQHLWFEITPIEDGTISSVGITSWGEGTRAAIANTWIKADPNGLLWGNPSMDIYGYFDDLISTTGIRVSFGSVLSTGSALNIFGQSYQTADGKILIGEELYYLNGLAVNVDSNNVVQIYSDNRLVTEYTKTSGTISGEGVWLWSATLYQITTTVVEDVLVHFGEGSSRDWMIFAFIGICVLGIVVFAAWGRGSMDAWDWVILGAAIIMGFAVI